MDLLSHSEIVQFLGDSKKVSLIGVGETVVAHPPQGLTSLLTNNGKRDFLNYCCLPVSWNQSGQCPLTSLISMAFMLVELAL